MNKKYLFILFAFLFLSSAFSQDEKMDKCEILEMFSDIVDSDQTNLDKPEIRQLIFEENFGKIINLIRNQGFIDIDNSFKKKKNRKTIESGFRATFIHILQSKPELILNNDVITLVSEEIEKNTIKRSYLIVPLSVFVFEFDESDKRVEKELDIALDKWGITRSELHS